MNAYLGRQQFAAYRMQQAGVVLGGARCGDEGGLDDSACVQQQALMAQQVVGGRKNLL